MKIILIVLLFTLGSCSLPDDALIGRIPTDIKNACGVIGGKYSEKLNCCYKRKAYYKRMGQKTITRKGIYIY